jgi:hypothetical protein
MPPCQTFITQGSVCITDNVPEATALSQQTFQACIRFAISPRILIEVLEVFSLSGK